MQCRLRRGINVDHCNSQLLYSCPVGLLVILPNKKVVSLDTHTLLMAPPWWDQVFKKRQGSGNSMYLIARMEPVESAPTERSCSRSLMVFMLLTRTKIKNFVWLIMRVLIQALNHSRKNYTRHFQGKQQITDD